MMAMENPKMVTAEAVEAMEFSELANQQGVHGVPHTTINHGYEHVVGAVPESNLLAAIQRAVSRSEQPHPA
jgi:predicted DsbA family dithiol-disulfide isomerase